MNATLKIEPRHLALQAVIYIRQSTPKQLQENTESTRRQYALADKAHELGWPRPLVTIIDDDLGLSGTSSTQRVGFQRLVALISLGEIGMVFVTEISRLSRLNSDWHRVIELCAVFATLIADEEGIYDPRDPNDRLLLGLKGTLFVAELQILRARMRGNLLNKARRGELALRLPVGYRRLSDGRAVLDPDEQVRAAITTVFEQFALLKNARAVQRYFYHQALLIPRHLQQGPDAGRILWVRPTYMAIQQILTSPVYAGVFVYGRRKRSVLPGDPPRSQDRRVPIEEWDIAIPGIYPSYISYDQYLANRRTLRQNRYQFEKKSTGAPREGASLLQGLAVCGRCGRRMTVSSGNGYRYYGCRRAMLTHGAPQCQAFSAYHLDAAIGAVFLQAVEPARLETTLAALSVLEKERQALDRQWQLRLERARYDVRLAQRQYEAVDPDFRLVARELEKRWNDALVALKDLEKEYELACQLDLAPLDAAEQEAVRALANDLPALWQAPSTTATDRKRLLRLVIREVTLTAHQETRSAEYVIAWHGGALTRHEVHCPPLGWHAPTAVEIIERIRALAPTLTDQRIAEQLNAEGISTKTGKPWTFERVGSMRKQYGIATGCPLKPTPQARGDGYVSARTAAARLGVSSALIHVWAQQGALVYDRRTARSKLWVRLTERDVARLTGAVECAAMPTITAVAHRRRLTREQVWALVRNGHYEAYRTPVGKRWVWCLRRLRPGRK